MGNWVRAHTLVLYIFALCAAPSFAQAQSGPNSLDISGGLFNSNGTPITNSNVNFKIEVYDKNATCLMYSEQHLGVDLSATKGAFSLIIGAGTSMTNVLESTTAFDSKIFENPGAVAAFTGCPSGLTLNAGDTRLIRVSYNLGSGYIAMTPDIPLTSAAYSMVAETLNGHSSSDFVLTNNNTSLQQANVEYAFSNTNWPVLKSLIDGTSGEYIPSTPTSAVGFNSQRLINVGTPSGASDAATKGYTDANLGGQPVDMTGVAPGMGGGKILTWDQTLGKWVAGSTGAVGLVAAGTGLTGGPITSSGTLSVDVGVTANKILQLNGSAQIPAVNGSLLTNINAVQIQGRDISAVAPANGNLLGWNSTTNLWEATPNPGGTVTGLTGDVSGSGSGVISTTINSDTVTSSKINSTGIAVNRLLITDGTTGATVGYSTCSLGEVLQWSATGWKCESVSLMLGNVGTAGTYGNSTQVAQVTVDATGRVTNLTNVNINFPVTSVNGHTGAVSLIPSDIVGLGTAATRDVGLNAGNVLQLLTNNTLPAIDGSQLTGVNAALLQGYAIATTSPGSAQVLAWNASSSKWEPTSAATGSVTSVAAGTGLTGGPITSNGTLAVDVGITANKIVQLDGSARLPAVDGSQLTNLGLTSSQWTTNGTSIFYNSGNVGIGTTTPQSNLEILNINSNMTRGISSTQISNDGTSASINLFKAMGTATSPAAVTGGVGIGGLKGFAYDGTNYGSSTSAGIAFYTEETMTPAHHGTGMTFYTTPTGTVTLTEGFRLTGSGQLGIATVAPTPGAIVDMAGTGTGLSSFMVPRDSTLNRPAGVNGMIRYNTTTAALETFANGSWQNLAGAGTGAYLPLAGGTMSGVEIIPAGTAGAPSLAINGSATTGMYSSGANNLSFATAGAQRLNIDQLGNVNVNGNLGVGTANPTMSLDVVGNPAGDLGARFYNSNSSGWANNLFQNDAHRGYVGLGGTTTPFAPYVDRLYMDNIDSAGLSFVTGPGDFRVYTGGAGANGEMLRITNSGAVGIGTTTPQALLDVATTASGQSAIIVPRDVTANRPSGVNGMIRYNTSSNALETFANGSWTNLAGAGTGAYLPLAGGTMTGAEQIPVGAAGTPSINFTGSPTTGIFSSATNNFSVATAGTQRVNVDQLGNVAVGTTSQLFVSASGYVGIGTSSPTSQFNVADTNTSTSAYNSSVLTLHVNPGSASTALYRGTFSNAYYESASNLGSPGALLGGEYTAGHSSNATVFGTTGLAGTAVNFWHGTISNAQGISGAVTNLSTGSITSATAGNFGIANSGGGTIGTGYGIFINSIAATNKWSIYASDATAPSYFAGNVGIGTTTPNYKLDVAGTVNASALMINGVAVGTSSSPWQLNGTNAYYNGGNVGIGTATPAVALDVRGNSAAGVINLQNNNTTGTSGFATYDATGALQGGFGWTNSAYPIGTLQNSLLLATTSGPIILATSSTERLRVDASGNVGIGTTTPTGALDVRAGTAAAGNGTDLSFYAQNGKASGATNGGNIVLMPGTANGAGVPGAVVIGSSTQYSLAPGAALVVTGASGVVSTDPSLGRGYNAIEVSNDNYSAFYKGVKSRGTPTSPLAAANGDYIVAVDGQAVDASNAAVQDVGWFGYVVNGTVTSGSVPADFIVRTGANGGGTEYLRVTSSGKVGINTTTPNYNLDVNGTINASAMKINGVAIGTSSSPFQLNGTNAYYNGGNVGIGTTTPAAPLDVNGTIAQGGSVVFSTLTGAVGAQNILIGTSAGAGISTAGNVLAIGYQAMPANDTGSNISIGNYSLGDLAGGGYNTVVGFGSLSNMSGGWDNVALGSGAGFNAAFTSSQNTLIGSGTGSNLKTATGDNSFLGYQAGYDVTTGNHNIIIGSYPTTGVGLTTGTNNILMGYDIRPPSKTTDNQLNIGNLIYATGLASGNTTSTGKFGIGTPSPQALLDIQTTTSGLSAILIPRDSTANRPPTGVNGMIRYNSSTNAFEGFANGTWGALASGSTSFPLIANPTGTIGAPAYSFNGKTNWGMYYDSANGGIGFSVAGSEIGYIDNSGIWALGSLQSQYDESGAYSPTGGSATPMPSTGPGLNIINSDSGVNGEPGFVNFQLSNSSGKPQNAYIVGLSNSGAANYSPSIAIGRQTGANAYAESLRIDGSGKVGIGTATPQALLDIQTTTSGQSAILLPRGSTAFRPPSGVNGMIRYNSSTSAFEGFANGSWGALASGGGGGLVVEPSTGSLIGGTTGASGVSTAGLNNTVYGYDALNFLSTGGNNTAVGYQAAVNLTSGSDNVAVGVAALANANTDSGSTAVGEGSLNAEVAGGNNTALGYYAGASQTSGSDNVSLGFNAGNNPGPNTPFNNNVFIGSGAATAVITNTNNNIAIGSLAATNMTGSNNLVIGYNVDVPIAGGNNQMTIGNLIYGTGIDGTGSTVSSGNIGIGTATPQALLDIQTATSGKSAILLPRGSTAFRPPTGVNGMIRYNSSTSAFEGFANGAWGNLAGAGGASQWTTSSSDIYYNLGNVGIGTATPNTALDVNGGIRAGSSTVVSSCGSGATNGEGTQRYNYSTHNMEYCNGSSWLPLNTGAPAATVGSARKAKMSVTAASASGTFTADQVVVATALNGSPFVLGSYSQSINLATTGAGGMDTGAAPASGFVALYAIYNPSGPTTSILACNVTTSSGSIYSGANMPGGYTASALIGIWPTNGSSQFVPGLIMDRLFHYQTAVSIFTGTTGVSTLTSRSISSGVPAAARTADLIISNAVNSGTNVMPVISGDSTGTGAVAQSSGSMGGSHAMPNGIPNSYTSSTFNNIPLITAQTIYWMEGNAGSDSMYVIGYGF